MNRQQQYHQQHGQAGHCILEHLVGPKRLVGPREWLPRSETVPPKQRHVKHEEEHEQGRQYSGVQREKSRERVVPIVRAADGQLLQLRGLGENSAWLFVMEFFSWREFRTRRQVGGLAGLTPTPYQSSEQSREQGIDKAGNSSIRSMAIEIAWGWLRHQPESELSQWFQRRFGQGSKRLRKIGIVALARKLLIALWRYLAYGEMPAGAQLKPA
jgi:transposase